MSLPCTDDIDWDNEFDAEMEPTRAAIEACMAEAGHLAHVYVENGIMVEPIGDAGRTPAFDAAFDRACDLVNQVAP